MYVIRVTKAWVKFLEQFTEKQEMMSSLSSSKPLAEAFAIISTIFFNCMSVIADTNRQCFGRKKRFLQILRFYTKFKGSYKLSTTKALAKIRMHFAFEQQLKSSFSNYSVQARTPLHQPANFYDTELNESDKSVDITRDNSDIIVAPSSANS